MKTKILALTGIRSEYDLLYPLLKSLNEDSKFELGVIVSGAHLSPLHNYSIAHIEADGFSIVDRIENLLYSNSLLGKAKSSAILMQSLAQTLDREKPDYLIVLGDREESVIGALTAGYMNIPTIHLAGGDNTFPEGGNIDEQVRHATTKLSHIHLTMTEEHSERIRKMGEEPWRVYTVGSGGVDRIRLEPELSTKELSELVGPAVYEKYAVLIYHSLSSNTNVGPEEIRLCFEALLEKGLHVFVGAPNSDPGSQGIVQEINRFISHPNVHTYKNLPRREFVNLLRNASCLIGNSSLALHEAPYLSLPAINVGERQRGRMAGANVQFVDGVKSDILKALEKVIDNEAYKQEIEKDRDIYGDGFMAEKTISIIKNLPPKRELLNKKITY